MAKKHYVNNKDFYEAIIAYKEKLLENPELRVPNYIGVCVNQICNRLSTKPNFIGYSWRDEMVADAIENCMYALPKFDPAKTNNPFAYFTQVAKNAFLRRIGLEKKEQYIKYKNSQNMQFNGEWDIQNDEVANEIISNFENRLTAVKKNVKVGIEKFADEVK